MGQRLALDDIASLDAATDLRRPGAARTFMFALASGALAGNLYYNQPLVSLIGADIGLSPAAESSLVTVAQLGYAVGLLFLVPLGDLLENRKVILATMALNVVALIGMAFSTNATTAFAAMLLVGLTSCAAQMIVPLAASLAHADVRGEVVGNVMTGLLGGILLARPIASFLAEFAGWHAPFVFSAGLIAVLTGLGLLTFPERRPQDPPRYGALIASLGRLFLHEPVLRRRALYHAALFGGFSLFWTAAPIVLMREPFGLSPGEVAIFALAGVLGVVGAPISGRIADRGLIRAGTAGAMALVALSFVLAGVAASSLIALTAAAILIDLGVQLNLVIGQREIFRLDASIRNRLNAVYMTTFFVGGAIGSAVASPVLELFGWPGICVIGAAMPAATLAYLATERR
ncbi:MFS transporter [Acuticoccus sediminis]|uniref:MFS transporter n=1 Tax=Acuticoccus sediminis TaxID=2184697 RepID=UPI001CFF4BF1|nr:MFS transporter [Acuticoccus sediminis]